jgi:predicted  nucleic acid-binding Zn-ribbon protein
MDELTPFAFWCQKVMPAVLDDSLSFYEVLCKLTAKLNDAIETINGHSELITTMQSEIDSLQTLTAQHTQQIADLTRKVQTNANNISAINTRTKGLSTKTDSANNWFGLNLQTDDSYVYRLAWSTDAPAASVLQTSRPGSVYYQIGGPQDDWTWAHVQNSTEGTQPAFTSISHTIYNQITSDINDVESSAAQNAQAIKALQDLTSGHSTAISSLQDSVGKNTQAITDLNNGLSDTNGTVAQLESNLETLEITVRNNSTAINTINTRTKGIVSNTAGTDGWYGITLDTDGDLNYRIAWCNNATKTMLSSSSRGSIYLFNQGVSSLTGTVGWSQTSANAVEAWYNGVGKSTMDNINSEIDNLNTRLTSIGSRTNTLENKTKGFSTVNDTVSGWFGFNLLVGSDNYRIGWSPSAPIETVTEASAPGSLYLTQTGLTGNTYGYSQTGGQEVQTLYNGSDTSSIETEIETLQTAVTEHTQQISALQDDVNNNVSDISGLQTNLTSATNTIKQVGNLANAINTRTKGISTKTDSSDNWFGINFSTDDSYIYRLAWSTSNPSSTVLTQSKPGSLYLRIGGVAPDIWLYGWNQNATSAVTGLHNAEPHS